ncbi:MAG: SurA N-terminal domain-containing protein [Nitrospirota bacterium]|jgi:peptidyl-prolyl cis-trans isomerase D
MLTTMRQSIRSLQSVLWLVIAAFIVTIFYAWGKGGAANNPAGILAWVDGDEILYRDYAQEFQNLALSFQQATGGKSLDPAMIEQLGLKRRALDNLVQRRLLGNAAEEIGIEVSDAELRDAIRNSPTFQDGGVFRKEFYDAFLRNRRITADIFETNQRELLESIHLSQLVRDSLTVSDAEVAEAYRQQAEKVRVAYAVVQVDQLLDRVTMTDDEIATYYAAHTERYVAPEEARIAYLTLRPEDFEAEVSPSAEELTAEYENHLEDFERPETVRARHILIRVADTADEATVRAAETRAQEVYERAIAGEDFATLARETSEDTTASVGGDLGEFHRGQMVPAFEDASFNAAAGEVVGPVRTSFGFHVIKVEAHDPGGLQPQEAVADELRRRVVERQAKTIALARASALQGQLADGADPAQVADDAGLTWQEAGPFSAADAHLPQPLVEALFETGEGQVGRPVEADDLFYVFRAVERIPARTKSLEEARVQVENDLRAEKAQALAASTAEEWRTALDSGGDLAELAGELGLSTTTTAPFTRANLPAALRAYGNATTVFELPEGRSAITLTGAGGVAVIHRLEIIPPDEAGLADARDPIERRLLAAKHQLAMEVLVTSLQQEAKIRYNDKVLTQVLAASR